MFSLAFLLIRDEADREFVKELFENYEQMMYKIALNILHSITDAEDTVQNTFIKVIDRLEKIRSLDSSEVEYYLITMTKNAARDMQKKANRFRENNIMEESVDTEAGRSVEDAVLTKIDSDNVKAALEKLSEHEYELLFLNLIVGYSPSEIAEQLGISSNTSRQRIYRAKQKLITELKKEGITNDI